MRKSRYLVFLLLFILIANIFAGVLVSAQDEVETKVKEFFKLPVIKYIIGIVFGLWDADDVADLYDVERREKLEVVSDAGAIIIYLVIWAVLFLAFADIVKTFSPFSDKVGTLIGLGLAIAAAQMGVVYKICVWWAGWTVKIGVWAVFIGLILAFLAFILENAFFEKLLSLYKDIRLRKKAEKAEATAKKAASGMKHSAMVEEELGKGGPF